MKKTAVTGGSMRLATIVAALTLIGNTLSAINVVGYVPHYRLPNEQPASPLQWLAYSPSVIDEATASSPDQKTAFLEYLTTHIFEGRITQVNYFAIRPEVDGHIAWGKAQPAHLDLLNRIKAVSPFRLVITVAGNANRFVPVVSNKTRRTIFVHNLRKIVNKWNLDGIDFDWEFPRNTKDLELYIRLMQETKKSIGAQLDVSVAIAREQLLTKELFRTVDYVNLMAYDFSGKHSTYESADEMVFYLTKKFNVLPDKLILGIPLYARVYSLQSRNYRRAMAYYHLVQQYSPSPQDTEVNGYYFNNYDTVKRKVQLARREKLSGVMFWELGQDLHDERSVLHTVFP